MNNAIGRHMNIPCKLLVVTAIAALVPISANAQNSQDAYSADSYYTAASPFEGVYAGIYTGARFNPGTAALLGVAVGANFTLI